ADLRAAVALEHRGARPAVEAQGREHHRGAAGHPLVERRPEVVGHERVDEDRGLLGEVEHAADVLRPVTGALGRFAGAPRRVRRGPAEDAGDDLVHATSFSTRSASVASGSTHSPVWTGEGWITVLDGATSQWNRSDCSSRATGPAPGSPAA